MVLLYFCMQFLKSECQGCMEALLEGAMNVNITDEDGMTCFHILAYKTCALCLVNARWLLDRGADINKQDCKGMTLLYVTTCSGKSL